MSDKFKYAPGKPGIGTKGEKGEDGKQGLGMYFTNFDPTTQSTIINTRIRDNRDLWSGGGFALPDDRNYVTGDIFFDQEGLAYEINAETDTFEYKFASLNMGGFFIPLGVSSSDGFQRYFNSNTTPRFLMDNVYTLSGAVDYTDVPEFIYQIEPKDFTRIEYTNIQAGANNYNPFTVYSSGENLIDNHKALAIVYDESNLAFRIGNMDNDNKIRNTNLFFDVSSLIHSKTSGGEFNSTTPEGAVLTNYEINANPLFNPNFNSSPDSFSAVYRDATKDVSISWNILDIVSDYDTASLYFIANKRPYSGSYVFDASTQQPMIFHDVQSTGNILITQCSSTSAYSCWMKITKNGWSRNTDIINAFNAVYTVSPSSYVLDSSAAATRDFAITSNTEWVASFIQNPESMMTLNSSSMISYDGSLGINVAVNTSTNGRTGKIRVAPILGGSYKDVSIYQPRGAIGPELFLTATSPSTAFTSSAWPYYTMDASWNKYVKSSLSVTVDVSSNRDWTTSGIPSWLGIVPSNGSAGVTSVTITVLSNNLSLNPRSAYVYFNNGSTTTLTFNQHEVKVWIETSEGTYDIDFLNSWYLEYDTGATSWLLNTVDQNTDERIYMNMRFTDNAPMPWAWDEISSTWAVLYSPTGTGNDVGPSLRAISETGAAFTMDGAIGDASVHMQVALSV